MKNKGYANFWGTNKVYYGIVQMVNVDNSMTANSFDWLNTQSYCAGMESFNKSVCQAFLSLDVSPCRFSLLLFPPEAPETQATSSTYLFYWQAVKQEHECCFPAGLSLSRVKAASSHKVFLRKKIEKPQAQSKKCEEIGSNQEKKHNKQTY